MSNALTQLIRHAPEDAKCLKRLVELITSGTLDDEWRADPYGVAACVFGALATLVLASKKYLDPDPDSPILAGSTVAVPHGPEREAVENACLELAGALDCECGDLDGEPIGRRARLIPWSLVLKALFAYLLEKLPDLIEEERAYTVDFPSSEEAEAEAEDTEESSEDD